MGWSPSRDEMLPDHQRAAHGRRVGELYPQALRCGQRVRARRRRTSRARLRSRERTGGRERPEFGDLLNFVNARFDMIRP